MKDDKDTETIDFIDDEYIAIPMPTDPAAFVSVLGQTMLVSLEDDVDPMAVIECAYGIIHAWLQEHDLQDKRIH